jgi:pimeloyl-ACP methyl ester carboxylesterase
MPASRAATSVTRVTLARSAPAWIAHAALAAAAMLATAPASARSDGRLAAEAPAALAQASAPAAEPAAKVRAAPRSARPLSRAAAEKIPKTLQLLQLGRGKRAYSFPVYANRDLAAGNLADIKHLIIVVHGVQRNADHYLATAMQAASVGDDPHPATESAAELARSTLVIAPKFANPNERSTPGLPAWRRSSWMSGEPSVTAPGRPAPMSSFQVLDDMLARLAEDRALPALADITLAGHSAGAQMIQRYAVLTPVIEKLEKENLAVHFVVANPSSYLYLTSDRPAAIKRGFGPYNKGICADYDSYKYGLVHLPPYAQESDAHKLAVRYAQRRVIYLLGGADNNPEHRLLDKTCGAEAQGATRLARGTSYLAYERTLTGAGSWTRHVGYRVEGVGHDAPAMFNSTCGVQALAGERAGAATDAATCTRMR